MWAQIAATIGAVMGNLTKAYDERQIDEDLEELERLLAEVRGQVEKEDTENVTATPKA